MSKNISLGGLTEAPQKRGTAHISEVQPTLVTAIRFIFVQKKFRDKNFV